MWFDIQQDDSYAPANGVEDRPPDGAYTLKGIYSSAGKWGLYCTSGGSNTAYVTRWTSQVLPSYAPVAPMLIFSTPNVNLVPVTVTFNSFIGDGKYEVQVTPADPNDYQEQYTDSVNASASSHVVWVRPGYTYNYRAREVFSGGAYGPWTPAVQLNTGSKVSGTPSTSLADTFPDILPDFVFETTSTGLAAQTKSNTGHYRCTSPQTGTCRTFKLVFSTRTSDEYQQLIDFFDHQRGKLIPFNWTAPDGTFLHVRFDADDYEVTYSEESSELNSPIAALTLPIREKRDLNLNISLTLNLDGSFF